MSEDESALLGDWLAHVASLYAGPEPPEPSGRSDPAVVATWEDAEHAWYVRRLAMGEAVRSVVADLRPDEAPEMLRDVEPSRHVTLTPADTIEARTWLDDWMNTQGDEWRDLRNDARKLDGYQGPSTSPSPS